MATLKCCIIDDEPLAVELLSSYVEKTPGLQLAGSFTSALQAMEILRSGTIDLLFLDIQMPDINGIEFSQIIPARCRIVFTTAFQQYAVDSYRVNALDYLLKPISYSGFLSAVQKAEEWFARDNNADKDFIFVKSDYKLKQIHLKKILYIEGLKDYVKIYLEDEPHPVLSLLSLKSLEEMLPENDFIRVHRSFIVQASKIKLIDRNRIVFGKEYIPISDSYKTAFNEFLLRHTPQFGKI